MSRLEDLVELVVLGLLDSVWIEVRGIRKSIISNLNDSEASVVLH